MATLTYILFFTGIAFYLGSAVSGLLFLRMSSNTRLLGLATQLCGAGALLVVAMIAVRAFQWRLVPLTTAVDTLSFFIALSGIVALITTRSPRRRGLLPFYTTPLALVALLAASRAVPALGTAPNALSGFWLAPHVGLVLLAFALFFTACFTSLAYALQARRLKELNTTGLFKALPSLENLDQTLFQLIRFGYPVFVFALLLGFLWARSEGMSPVTFMTSPKVMLSVVMVFFYAFSYHARSLGLLRGPKLAYLVFGGVAVLLGIFLALEVMDLFNLDTIWGLG